MMLFGNITVCTSTISSAGAELVATEAEAAGVRAGVVTAGVATAGGAMAGGSSVVAGALAVAPCQQADRGALGQEAWQRKGQDTFCSIFKFFFFYSSSFSTQRIHV